MHVVDGAARGGCGRCREERRCGDPEALLFALQVASGLILRMTRLDDRGELFLDEGIAPPFRKYDDGQTGQRGRELRGGPSRREGEDDLQQQRGEEGLAAQGVWRRDQQRPERVRRRLHALPHVPAQAVAVDEVVHGAEGDVNVVAHPRGADEEEREDKQREAAENSGRAGHGRGKFITIALPPAPLPKKGEGYN